MADERPPRHAREEFAIGASDALGRAAVFSAPFVREALHRLDRRAWRVSLVGGAIRDLYLAPDGTLPRDLDLIVEGAGPGDLEDAFGDLIERRTRFGGLRLSDPNQPTLPSIDIWRIEETWGICRQGLEPTVANFVKTPFFNLDAVAIELGRPGAPIAERGFFQGMNDRLLDINYQPNPFPVICAVRALVLALTFDLCLSPALAGFVLGSYHDASLGGLMLAQHAHYGVERCSASGMERCIATIRSSLAVGLGRIDLSVVEGSPLDRPNLPASRRALVMATGGGA